jgi:putative CocE/NonD family hydrolase
MANEDSVFPHKVTDTENVWITMLDGCRLASRIWLPEVAEQKPVPAILEYIPYRKRDFMRRRDESMHPWLAGHGYAVLRVDMRGSGESDGLLHDEYLKQEQDDALEVIAWIARQPWCSGAVGMMGKSWGAYNSLQVAARRPPALKAIVAVMGTDDRFAECIHFAGGCLLNDNFWWGAIMQIFNARPPDPAIVGERWREMWLERLKVERFWPEIWLQHQTLDGYWSHGSVAFDYGAIACPAWIWGGWADLFRDTPFRLAAGLKGPHKVTVGPWAHLYPHEGLPGPAVGFLQETLRWWDHWLKRQDDGLMREPPYRFYMMESVKPAPAHADRPGRWIAEETWPSSHIAIRCFAVNARSLDAEAAPEQPLELASLQTTGLASGEWGSFAIPGDIPGHQSLDSFGSLEFDSEPLAERLEMLGNAEAILELAVDRPDALVAVRVIDVAPDSAATAVARGFLNLTHRASREVPTPLVPGQRYRVKVQLGGTAYAFPSGHRIRLAISTAYWPIVWPSPEPVVLTLFTGASQLLLPIRQPQLSDAELPPFPEPVASPPFRMTTLRKGRIERSVTIDQITGGVSHRLFIDGGVFGDWGKFRLDDIGLEMGHVYERVYSIRPDDPNSAKASMNQSYEMGRGDWQIKIDAGAEMTSTPASFELNAWVEAFEGKESICRRDWKSSVKRTRV